jgi:hypothetical protein
MALHNQHKAIGTLGAGADGVKGSMACNSAGGSGRGMTLTPVTGLGRQWKGDKDATRLAYARQVKADRKAAAADRRSGMWQTERLAVNF